MGEQTRTEWRARETELYDVAEELAAAGVPEDDPRSVAAEAAVADHRRDQGPADRIVIMAQNYTDRVRYTWGLLRARPVIPAGWLGKSSTERATAVAGLEAARAALDTYRPRPGGEDETYYRLSDRVLAVRATIPFWKW